MLDSKIKKNNYDEHKITLNDVYNYCDDDIEFYFFLLYDLDYNESMIEDTMLKYCRSKDAYNQVHKSLKEANFDFSLSWCAPAYC